MAFDSNVRHKRDILPLGAALLVVGIAFFIVGIFWARYAGGGLIAVILLVVGIGLATHQAGLERGGHQRLWRTRTSVSPTDGDSILSEGTYSSQFDSEILNDTRTLASRLGIRKFHPTRVVWGPSEDQIRNVASKECHFDHDNIVLSSRLKNVLTAEEWTPLIAVSLIYEKKLMPRVFRKRQLALLIPWILGLAGLVVLASYPGNSIIAIPLILWTFLPLAVSIRIWGRTDRRIRLTANSQAGDLVGREELGRVLAKIGERITGPLAETGEEFPTISERLSKLEPVGIGFQQPEIRRAQESLQIQETSLQARSKTRVRRRFLFTIIFLVCLIVPVTAFLAWDNSICPNLVIVPAGSRFVIGSQSHLDYPFRVDNVVWGPNRLVHGSFTASRPISMFTMTSSQFDSFNSTGKPGTYLFDSGQVTSARYECGGSNCPPQPFAPRGQNYVELYNPDSLSSATVTIDENFLLGSC